MNYTEFKNKWMNKGVDVDGYYGFQCWDSFAQWCVENNIPVIDTTPVNAGGSGYAQDLWEKKSSNGILKYFDEVEMMEEGDVAVFKKDPNWTPESHVALFDHDAGGGFGWFFGQNQGGIPGAKGGACHNLVKLPYSATYPTAFRLKKSITKNTGGTQLTLPAKNINGEIYSGLITGTDPNIMNSDDNRTKIDRIIIHHNAGTSDEGARRTWYVSTGIGTSAHYQVTPDKIWGCVGENYVAYHAGNYPMNQRSIGIEHLNNTGAPTWTIAEETYRNSAKLIRDICERNGIPIDRQHILKHGEVVPTACPGGIDIDKLVRMARDGVSTQQDKQPTGKVVIRNVDQKNLTYDVVLTGLNSPSGVKGVSFPTWTEKSGQDDLIWHEGVRQPNGEYVYKVKASEHKNEQGKYISHCYVVTNSGKQWGVGGTDIILNKEPAKGTIEVIASDPENGTFTVRATNVSTPNGVKGVTFPIWTDANGQDDLIWHQATKQADGSWVYKLSVKDHKNEYGKYIIHGYAVMNNDQLSGFAGISFELNKDTKPSQDEIIVVTKSDAKIKHVILSAEEFDKLNK